MKLIHISDLHIGKKVKNFPMIDDQRVILDQILDIIREERPQAVLIAGDVYDKAAPSAKAIELLDEFLVKLSAIDTQSFIISGNHDSQEQIAFANKLIAVTGIHMSPIYHGEIKPFTIEDEHGPVDIYMLPFIKPIYVRRYFPEADVSDYTDAVRTAIDAMKIDTGRRNILVAHQFVTGASRCDSEVSVGGLDNVDGGCFDDFDYVALGHIHTPQNVHKNHIRYCGTPLKYSFSEVGQDKSVTVVELGAKGDVSISTRPLKPEHDFVKIEGTFDEIVNKYGKLTNNDYTEIILKDEYDIPDAFRKLQPIFPLLMQLSYDNKRTRERKEISDAPIAVEVSEIELISRLFEMQNNQPLTLEQMEYLESVIADEQEERQ